MPDARLARARASLPADYQFPTPKARVSAEEVFRVYNPLRNREREIEFAHDELRRHGAQVD